MTPCMLGIAFPAYFRGPARRLFALCLVVFMLCGCQARSFPVMAALEDQGELYIYAAPLPQEAKRLRFVLQGLSALKDDGSEHPLILHFSEFSNTAVPRQTLLATGRLPPGHYLGLVVQASAASLQSEEGEVDMLVAEPPVRLDHSFHVAQKKSALLQLRFDYSQALQAGVSFAPVFGAAVPKRPLAGLLGYVANAGANNITVFDKKALQVVGMLATGAGPSGVALDTKHQRAYVTLAREDAVEVVDVMAGDTIARIRLQAGDQPAEPAITPAGNLLLVANRGSNTVSLIDPLAAMELVRLPVGSAPHSVLIDRAGNRGFVFNSLSGTVTVIDLARQVVTASLATGGEPLRGAINREGDRLFVIHRGSPYLSVVNLATLEIARVFVGLGMSALKVDTRSDLLYLARGAVLEVFDPLGLYPMDTLTIDAAVSYMAIDGDENNLYLVLPGKRQVAVYSLDSRKRIATLDTGDDPCWLNLMGER